MDARKTDAYQKGYDAKSTEVREMGWVAARDKFMLDVPPGVPITDAQAYFYARGENEALHDLIPASEKSCRGDYNN